jgi:ribonuclease I
MFGLILAFLLSSTVMLQLANWGWATVAGVAVKADTANESENQHSPSSLRKKHQGSSCDVSDYVLAFLYDCGYQTVHGLWPDPEASCTFCTEETFSPSKISSQTLKEMQKYWPTCQSSNTNKDFWSQ